MKRNCIYIIFAMFFMVCLLYACIHNKHTNYNELYSVCTDENNINIEFENNRINLQIPLDFILCNRDTAKLNYSSKYLSSNNLEQIYDIIVSDRVIGAIGISTYDTNTTPPELIDIYGAVALDNGYHFCINEDFYKEIQNKSSFHTGITKVYYSPLISSNVGYGKKVIYNDGVLAHNSDINLLLAIEFESELLSNASLISIAQNITIIQL